MDKEKIKDFLLISLYPLEGSSRIVQTTSFHLQFEIYKLRIKRKKCFLGSKNQRKRHIVF